MKIGYIRTMESHNIGSESAATFNGTGHNAQITGRISEFLMKESIYFGGVENWLSLRSGLKHDRTYIEEFFKVAIKSSMKIERT